MTPQATLRLRAEILRLRQRTRSLDQGPVLLLEHDGSTESEAALEEAMKGAAEYDGFACVAVIVDQSAGTVSPSDDEEFEDRPRRIVRRLTWDMLEPVPGLVPGEHRPSGRRHFGVNEAGHRIFGQVGDEPVTLDGGGNLIFVADLEGSE